MDFLFYLTMAKSRPIRTGFSTQFSDKKSLLGIEIVNFNAVFPTSKNPLPLSLSPSHPLSLSPLRADNS